MAKSFSFNCDAGYSERERSSARKPDLPSWRRTLVRNSLIEAAVDWRE